MKISACFPRHPKLRKFLIITSCIFTVFILSKDFILKQCVQSVATDILGTKVSIEKFSLSFLFAKVRLRGLVIGNPEGFPGEKMLVMPEITVQLDSAKALRGEFHFPLIVINLNEAVVIRNSEGRLNIDALKPIEEEMAARKHSKPEKPSGPLPELENTSPDLQPVKKKTPPVNLKVDELRLNVERVLFWDYSKGDKPVLEVFELDLKDKILTDIHSPADLITRVIIEAVKPTAIRQAGMLAATSLLGVGFLPAAALGVIVAKDDIIREIKLSEGKIIKEAVQFSENLGKLKKVDEKKGQVFALIHDCDVVFTVEKKDGKNMLKIQVRKYFLPKSSIAAGLMYRFEEHIK